MCFFALKLLFNLKKGFYNINLLSNEYRNLVRFSFEHRFVIRSIAELSINGLLGGKLNLPYHSLHMATARDVENCGSELMRLSCLISISNNA